MYVIGGLDMQLELEKNRKNEGRKTTNSEIQKAKKNGKKESRKKNTHTHTHQQHIILVPILNKRIITMFFAQKKKRIIGLYCTLNSFHS